MKAKRSAKKPARSSGGAPKQGSRKGDKKAVAKRKLQQKRLREEQGGSLPKRPDIKGLDGGRYPNKSRNFDKDRKEKQGKHNKLHPERKRREAARPRGPRDDRGPHGASDAGDSTEAPRKRKLVNGHERLRALLEKHPHLLDPGESADAAVAACFKKTGRPHEGSSADATAPAEGDSTVDQLQQQLSGSKRRKLLRLVMNSRTAEDKVFIHEAYQLYNEILRSIRTAEGPEGPPGARSDKLLKSRVAKAIAFLEAPLDRVCSSNHCIAGRYILLIGCHATLLHGRLVDYHRYLFLHFLCRKTATAARLVSLKFVSSTPRGRVELSFGRCSLVR